MRSLFENRLVGTIEATSDGVRTCPRVDILGHRSCQRLDVARHDVSCVEHGVMFGSASGVKLPGKHLSVVIGRVRHQIRVHVTKWVNNAVVDAIESTNCMAMAYIHSPAQHTFR